MQEWNRSRPSDKNGLNGIDYIGFYMIYGLSIYVKGQILTPTHLWSASIVVGLFLGFHSNKRETKSAAWGSMMVRFIELTVSGRFNTNSRAPLNFSKNIPAKSFENHLKTFEYKLNIGRSIWEKSLLNEHELPTKWFCLRFNVSQFGRIKISKFLNFQTSEFLIHWQSFYLKSFLWHLQSDLCGLVCQAIDG